MASKKKKFTLLLEPRLRRDGIVRLLVHPRKRHSCVTKLLCSSVNMNFFF